MCWPCTVRRTLHLSNAPPFRIILYWKRVLKTLSSGSGKVRKTPRLPKSLHFITSAFDPLGTHWAAHSLSVVLRIGISPCVSGWVTGWAKMESFAKRVLLRGLILKRGNLCGIKHQTSLYAVEVGEHGTCDISGWQDTDINVVKWLSVRESVFESCEDAQVRALSKFTFGLKASAIHLHYSAFEGLWRQEFHNQNCFSLAPQAIFFGA